MCANTFGITDIKVEGDEQLRESSDCLSQSERIHYKLWQSSYTIKRTHNHMSTSIQTKGAGVWTFMDLKTCHVIAFNTKERCVWFCTISRQAIILKPIWRIENVNSFIQNVKFTSVVSRARLNRPSEHSISIPVLDSGLSKCDSVTKHSAWQESLSWISTAYECCSSASDASQSKTSEHLRHARRGRASLFAPEQHHRTRQANKNKWSAGTFYSESCNKLNSLSRILLTQFGNKVIKMYRKCLWWRKCSFI